MASSPIEKAPPSALETADAIVLVDHGSRRKEANGVVIEIAARLQARLPGKRILPAHCELASPTLPEAVAQCVAEGARRIVIQPYYLVPGRHSREDIPRIVADLVGHHPEVRFWVGDPLGVHDAMIEALADRIATASEPGL